jgi:hypothetical protein
MLLSTFASMRRKREISTCMDVRSCIESVFTATSPVRRDTGDFYRIGGWARLYRTACVLPDHHFVMCVLKVL